MSVSECQRQRYLVSSGIHEVSLTREAGGRPCRVAPDEVPPGGTLPSDAISHATAVQTRCTAVIASLAPWRPTS
jgi:hypothetical protein